MESGGLPELFNLQGDEIRRNYVSAIKDTVFLENLVYLHLKRAGYKVYSGVFRNKEIDFVALKDDRILYVQATYLLLDEKTIEREYSPLEAIPDNYEKIVVSLDDIRFPQKNGIKHEQIWKFNFSPTNKSNTVSCVE